MLMFSKLVVAQGKNQQSLTILLVCVLVNNSVALNN